MDVTQGHCGLERGQGLLLRMGKGLGTPTRPSESVYLGHSAHMCGYVGNLMSKFYMPSGNMIHTLQMMYAIVHMLEIYA